MADQEDVAGQCGLEHDGHVGSVEEADWVGTTHAALPIRLDRNLNTEALQIDDRSKDNQGRNQVHDVGKILPVEGFTEGALLVRPGEQKVEEGDDGALELRTTTCIDGCGRKCFPDDRLADVGSNEKGNAAAQTVSLL